MFHVEHCKFVAGRCCVFHVEHFPLVWPSLQTSVICPENITSFPPGCSYLGAIFSDDFWLPKCLIYR